MAFNVHPTPRADFQASSDNIKAHHELIQQPGFQAAIKTALAQYGRQLTDSPPPDMGGSASYYLRLQGAHEFVTILMNLAETPNKIIPVNRDNLNHKI